MNNSSESNVEDALWFRLINFDEFITSKLIKIIYVGGTALILIGAIGGGGISSLTSLIVAFKLDSPTAIIGSLFFFLVSLVAGLLFALLFRVYCELLIAIFKINESLIAIKESR